MELRRGRDGKLLRYFYGRYKDETGKSIVANCGKWRGNPPASGSLVETGDETFEKSRRAAQDCLNGFQDEARRKGRAAHLVERMIEAKTGQTVEHVCLRDLYDRWRANSPGSVAHAKHAGAAFAQFADHVEEVQPGASYCYQVTRETVEGWAEKLRAALTSSTARRKLRLLKTTFARALPIGAANPFEPLPWTRGVGTGEEVPRRPLTEEELARLIETSKWRTPILHPLIVCAAYSGLRRGDVCRLKWAAVDLQASELVLRTSKTGERVAIPILPPLREVLAEAAVNRNPGQKYVWPLAARMIEANPNGLSLPFKKISKANRQGDRSTDGEDHGDAAGG